MTSARAASAHHPATAGAAVAGRGLRIAVVAGVGQGRTPLSAFDAALARCGVHDYNLLPLSSVIPPGSTVVAGDRIARPAEEFGHKLYVVKAEARSATPGTVVAAGLGWCQWGDGRGVFVEHHLEARGEACAAVEAALSGHLGAALRDLCAVRNVAFEEAGSRSRVAVARVGGQATTALVVAVYQAEGWR
jgi:arginine decarboxylase